MLWLRPSSEKETVRWEDCLLLLRPGVCDWGESPSQSSLSFLVGRGRDAVAPPVVDMESLLRSWGEVEWSTVMRNLAEAIGAFN